MKRVSWSRTTAVVLTTLLIFCLAPAMQVDDHHSCSYHTVSGNWGFRLSGSALTDPSNFENYGYAEPLAGLGTFTLDKSGNITGRGSYKSGNSAYALTFTGTYTVDADCTGSQVMDVILDGEDQGPYHFDLVFVDNAREIHWISTEPELVMNVDGKKLFGD